jgi:hypothetical protein
MANEKETRHTGGENPVIDPITRISAEVRGVALRVVSAEQVQQLDVLKEADILRILQNRIDPRSAHYKEPKHYKRPKGIDFDAIERALKAHPRILWSIYRMNELSCLPDIICETADEYIFASCSAETPMSCCDLVYDDALKMSEEICVPMMDESQTLQFHAAGTFDRTTSSWVKTPADIRSTGDALYSSNESGSPLVKHDKADESGSPLVKHDKADFKDTKRGWRGWLVVPKKRR